MNHLLSMSLLNGRPALLDGAGHPMLTDIQAGVEYTGNTWNRLSCWDEGEWALEGSEAQGIVRCANVSIEYHREDTGMALRVRYTHMRDSLKSTDRFYSLHALWRCGFSRCLYNAPTEANGVQVNEMQSLVHTVRLTDGQRLSGTENMALIDSEGNHILAGYISFERYFPCLEIGSEGRFNAFGQLEKRPLQKGETIWSDWLYIGLTDDARWGLIDYARIAARQMNSRAGKAETPYGFCTWYYYGGGLKPKNVYENLEILSKNRNRLDVKYFNLDDGWYKAWGDWSENEKFSCGMKKIADAIRAEGYLPGIWLAPLGGKKPSRLYDAHPDWFVRQWDSDEAVTNQNEWGCYLALDMSHPEVKTYIHDLYHRISHEWGYRHIKIDIISPSLMPGRYYDPSYTVLMNYREGLRLIREAITEDTVLLTCTAPMGGSIGYADGMRTSGDIFEDWSCLLSVFNQNLKRYYYNKVWFNNDPDCLLVRSAENEDEECIRQCVRTEAEIRTFATALMATGGAVILSDKLPLLKESQLDLLGKMFPINTQAAIPLDLMESEVPGILDLGRREKTRIFALINWTDVKKSVSLNIGDGHVFEFWSQDYLGRMQGERRFLLEPHGAKILFVTDPAPLSAIGVNDCLCPTIRQEYTDGRLTGAFIKKDEKLFVVSEKAIRSVSGCAAETVCAERGLYLIRQTGDTLSFCIEEV